VVFHLYPVWGKSEWRIFALSSPWSSYFPMLCKLQAHETSLHKARSSICNTERLCEVVNTLASYSVSPLSNLRLEDANTSSDFMNMFSSSRQILGQWIKAGHDHLLPNLSFTTIPTLASLCRGTINLWSLKVKVFHLKRNPNYISICKLWRHQCNKTNEFF
jgi:hypothetical protein